MLAALAQELFDATQPGNSVDIPQLISQFTFQSNLVLGLVLLVSAARPRVIAALDWLLVTCTVRGPWRRPLLWLCYPVAFLIFSWGAAPSTAGIPTTSWTRGSTAAGRQ